MLGNMIGGFVVILVGTSLVPSVAYNVTLAQGNVTDASAKTLLGLTTVFFALSIMSAAIATGVAGLRQAGMI